MERYYLSCTYCERPMAVNVEEGNTIEEVAKSACPLCGEVALRIMGRVEKTDIVRSKTKAACDLRCTNAVGPKCDCLCVNANHGTHRLVVFNKVVGKLEVVEKDLLNNNEEYLARIKRMAAAKVDIKQRVLAFLYWKYNKVLQYVQDNGAWRLYGEDWKAYSKFREIEKKIDKIEDLRSVQRKINQLVKLIPQIGDNLSYIEAVAEARKV